MKIKKRLILDLILFVVLLIVMKYEFTGNLIHEILGILLIVGFLFHIFINRKYYRLVTKNKSSKQNAGKHHRVKLVLNVILLVATMLMLLTSFAISHNLFGFANGWISHYAVWRVIHIICAIVMLICVFIHALFHRALFATYLKNQVRDQRDRNMIRYVSRIVAIVLTIAILEMSVDNVASLVYDGYRKKDSSALLSEDESEQSKLIVEELETDVTNLISAETEAAEEILDTDDDSDDTEVAEASPEEETTQIVQEQEPEEETTQIVQEPESAAEPEVTLSDYLGGMFCTGCGRHCCLLTPRCGKGERQASEAESQYYEIYGEV